MAYNCKIIISNDFEMIEHISSLIESICNSIGFSTNEKFRLKLALEETLTNTIESCIDDENVIEISIEQLSGGIEIIMKDDGLPFNPFKKNKTNEARTDFDTPREDISELLIHKLVDSHSYENLGKKGKESRLKFYSQNFRINNLLADIKPKSEESITDDKMKFVRIFQNEDAYEVSKLFYLSYGYSYVNELVYFPDRILENIENGRMHSAVAVSEKGVIIGFISLFEPDRAKNITEWGMAVSDPLYRGQGIMNENLDFIVKKAESLTYDGIYAHSVTNHIFTQKVCAKLGFTTCALLVGYAPDLKFKKINTQLSQRESTFVDFRYFKKPVDVKIYLPQEYSEIITKIYHNLGIDIEVLQIDENKDFTPINQQIVEKCESVLKSVYFYVDTFGNESLDYIKKMTKHHCINQIDNLYIFINMEDEFAIANIDSLELMGYFFVGIFPNYVYSHTIIYQYVNNFEYDFDKIHSYSDLSEDLKNTISTNMNKVNYNT
jgi:anti-sigma regulatory factor (Ser/Thr protein kinase)/RimJ/RimL family protein N-acetyltransferase